MILNVKIRSVYGFYMGIKKKQYPYTTQNSSSIVCFSSIGYFYKRFNHVLQHMSD